MCKYFQLSLNNLVTNELSATFFTDRLYVSTCDGSRGYATSKEESEKVIERSFTSSNLTVQLKITLLKFCIPSGSVCEHGVFYSLSRYQAIR